MGQQRQPVEKLFGAALEMEPEARRAFLDAACHDEPELKHPIEQLLMEDERAGELAQKRDSPSRTTVWWSSSRQPKAFPGSPDLTVPEKSWKNYPEPAIAILLSPAMILCSQSPPTMITTANTTSIFTISPGVQAPASQMEGQKYFRFSRLTAKGWHMQEVLEVLLSTSTLRLPMVRANWSDSQRPIF